MRGLFCLGARFFRDWQQYDSGTMLDGQPARSAPVSLVAAARVLE